MSSSVNYYHALNAAAQQAVRNAAPPAMPKKKPRAKRKSPERDFQIKLVRDLRKILPPDVFLTHFPSGGGGAMRGKFLKVMGLVPGVGDLLLIHKGLAYFLELKSATGTISDIQLHTALALDEAGAPTRVVRSLDDAMDALAEWNIPTRLSAQGAR